MTSSKSSKLDFIFSIWNSRSLVLTLPLIFGNAESCFFMNSLGILLIGYSQRIFKVLLHHFLCRRGTPKWVFHYFKKLVLQLFLKCPFFGVRGTIKKKIKPGNFFLSGLWRFLVVTAFFRNDHPQTNNFVNDVTNHRKSGFYDWNLNFAFGEFFQEICAIQSRWRPVYFLEGTFLKVFHLLGSFLSFLQKKWITS